MNLSAYLASPLGFSEAGRHFYYGVFIPMIESTGFTVLDPWRLTPEDDIIRTKSLPYGPEQRARWKYLNRIIGRNNVDAISRCDILIAILDGPDVDSGTAAEVGFAAGLNKQMEGYRGDFRISADNPGATVNLQVEYFIDAGAGIIASTIGELERTLRSRYEQLLTHKNAR